jgi:hypothetical protein
MPEKELPRWIRMTHIWAQIASPVIIPVIVALMGWWIQSTIAQNSTRLGYL